MPDWVHIWFWLRFIRGEQVLTALPQQGINPDAMSMSDYDSFVNEWVEAGAPQTTATKVVMAMTGGAIFTEDDIPF